MADQGVPENGLLNLARAGWSTYNAYQLPGELSGVVAGCVVYDDDDLGLPSVLIVSVLDDVGHVATITTGIQITPEIEPVESVAPKRVPFAVPVPTRIAAPTTVRVQLFCRPQLVAEETFAFDLRTAGEPDYEIRFAVPLPPCVDDNAGEPINNPGVGALHPRPSWVARCMEKALEEWQAGDHESSMLFATVAVDGTARRAYPDQRSSRRRFTDLIRKNALVFERFGAPLLDVAGSRFENAGGIVRPTAGDYPDIADIIYSIHRCSYAHGDDVPAGFFLTEEVAFRIGLDDPGPGVSVELPKKAIIGLLAVCLLEPANADLRVRDDGFELSWTPPGDGEPEPLHMMLNQWFGRRDDFLEHQSHYGRSRVTIQPGREWQVMIEEGGGIVRITHPDPDDASGPEGGSGVAPTP